MGIRTIRNRADGFCDFITIHFRHHNIHKDHVEGVRRIFCEGFHCFLAIRGSGNPDSLFLQLNHCDLRIQIIILRQKDLHTRQVYICNRMILFLNLALISQLQR